MEPRRVHEVVHTLREKPLRVRENIALGVAGGVTFIVAVLWFVANAHAGTFSLGPASSTLAANAPQVGQAVESGSNGFTQLLGAAASAVGASSSPAQVEIVNTSVETTFDGPKGNMNDTDQKVIHF